MWKRNVRMWYPVSVSAAGPTTCCYREEQRLVNDLIHVEIFFKFSNIRQDGEEWRLCVFISNSKKDIINVRSSCGSLSFCGASGLEYPDKRPMGYPFATRLKIKGEEVILKF